jgi:methyl-accepting chemotaxis protein
MTIYDLLYGAQIPNPSPTPLTLTGDEVNGVIDAINSTASTFQDFTIGLAALFVFAIFGIALIAYFYFNRNASKGAQDLMTTFASAMGSTMKEKDERIDALEKAGTERDEKFIESLSAIGDGMNRIADVVTLMQKTQDGKDRVLSDAVSTMTTLVTVGSKPLQQVVKDVSAIQSKSEEIHTVVSAIFDRFLKVFPTESDMEKRITELEHAIIQSVATVSEQKKHDTGEIAPILPTQIELTVITPPDLPKASGE